MKLIHRSPMGALDIPGHALNVAPGDVFEVPDEVGTSLLEQSDLYQEAPERKTTK